MWDLRRRVRIALGAAGAILLAIGAPALAQGGVDLQLVLAVDASGSVDQYRFELQKRGYAAAFRHPHVLGALRSGPNQAIAATMVQWTGPTLHVHERRVTWQARLRVPQSGFQKI